jgi:hypothetical protein
MCTNTTWSVSGTWSFMSSRLPWRSNPGIISGLFDAAPDRRSPGPAEALARHQICSRGRARKVERTPPAPGQTSR